MTIAKTDSKVTNVSQLNMESPKLLIPIFEKILGPQFIITDKKIKETYETEWRNRYQNIAVAVLFPRTTKQVQEIVLACKQHKIGIVPQGGNTSMCGGSIPDDSGRLQVILNLSKMNKILAIDTVNSSITVEAGSTLLSVISAAKQNDLYFPLSIGAEGSCQIGGNIATNAGGIHVICYGMMRDLILGLEVVLADGTIINQLTGLRKNNTNFDLKQLFIGSEGTLGIITRATLKLFPQPQGYITILCGMDSITDACSLLSHASKHFRICAFEIINELTQQIYNTHFQDNAFSIKAPWLVLFEFESSNDKDIEKLANLMELECIDLNKTIIASNNKEQKELWNMREKIPLAEKAEGFAVKHDISLPISCIGDFIDLNKRNILNKFKDARIIIFGHLGDGNLHYNIKFKDRDYESLQQIEHEVNQLVYKDVFHFNGSFSAEHGVGKIKKAWFKMYYDETSYSLAKSIKNMLDPDNILNPGKIF